MSVDIRFKNGTNAIVEKITKIKIIFSDGTTDEYSDFSSVPFTLIGTYTFIGESTVCTSSSEILYVQFN